MVELRLLVEGDAQELWQFRLAALEESPHSFEESAEELRSTHVDATAERLRASSDENFVVGAFVDARLVGTAGFFRNQGAKTCHKGRIWGVHVHPAFRRSGIGRTMLRALLVRIRAIAGLRQVSLSVATTQVAATALYESVGFRCYGLEPRALRIGDSFIDEDLRILLLDSSA